MEGGLACGQGGPGTVWPAAALRYRYVSPGGPVRRHLAFTAIGATSLLHSKTFYEAVNQVSPVRIKDPLRYVAGRLAGRNRP